MYKRQLWHRCVRYVGFVVSSNGEYGRQGTASSSAFHDITTITKSTNLQTSPLTPGLNRSALGRLGRPWGRRARLRLSSSSGLYCGSHLKNLLKKKSLEKKCSSYKMTQEKETFREIGYAHLWRTEKKIVLVLVRRTRKTSLCTISGGKQNATP